MHRLIPSLILLSVILAATAARADIFQWEYIDPADPSQGKRQSTTLCIDGAGVNAMPGADLSYRNLPMAYLDGADLMNAIGTRTNLTKASFVGANLSGAHITYDGRGDIWEGTSLTDADLSQANLSDATFDGAHLTNADLTGAEIRGASFNVVYDAYWNIRYGGLTLAQLYSTASYQTYDLAGINLGGNDLAGGNFAHQNLTNSSFSAFDPNEPFPSDFLPATLIGADFTAADVQGANFHHATLTGADFTAADIQGANFFHATLTGADFTGADVRGATFDNYYNVGTGITLAQLYSTASYAAHDLSGIGLGGNNLAGANFAGQNLTNANLGGATLTGADFTGAKIRGARFDIFHSPDLGTGITPVQLASTASYQAHDLSGISLQWNNLAGAKFSGQNLTDAGFQGANLTNADLSQAVVTGAAFYGAKLSGANLSQVNLSNSRFDSADMTNTNLSHSNLTGANLDSANLTGADFTNAEVRGARFSRDTYYAVGGITLAQLYSTASYAAQDLSGIDLDGNDLAGANLSGQNLTGANLNHANLTGADFTNAEVRGASFGRNIHYPGGSGIALAQLYSTASYAAHDLSGIVLWANNLSGANFAGQNIANADFEYATLTGADFTAADARGAVLYSFPANAITTNFIRRDGHINGLVLDGGGLLVMRDYDGPTWNPASLIPITVEKRLAMGPGGTLRMVFEADAWDSTISFASGIPVALGGTLELMFAADVNPVSQLGRTFDLFNWTGVTPTGAFAISGPYVWDLSNLYTTGQVTLTAIPEPSSLALFFLVGATLFVTRRTRSSASLSPTRRSSIASFLLSLSPLLLVSPSPAQAGIFQWEYINPANPYSFGKQQSTTLAPDGAGVDAVPGAELGGLDLTMAYLGFANLTDANLTSARLNDAYLRRATLVDADFTGAQVRDADFADSGINLAQLYSTASYAAHDLRGIGLRGNQLCGANFAGHNLAGASFFYTNLAGADLSRANLSGARFDTICFRCEGANLSGADLSQTNLTHAIFGEADLGGADLSQANLTNAQFYSYYYGTLAGADFTGADLRGALFESERFNYRPPTSDNLIDPEGHISGLELDSGELLIIRDYDGGPPYNPALPPIPITVEQHLAMGPGGTLRMVFEGDAWDSTISFAPGIPITLGGTLELTFAADVNLATQLGRTFDLFNWTGVTPTGAFAVSSPYVWDLSNLYTTGEITLAAIPEPTTVVLLIMAAGMCVNRRHTIAFVS